jgi:enoyl-CoA hydratase/carnithine racemase
MSDDNLLESREGTVARLVLNRPDARNALSLELLETTMALATRIAEEGIDAFIEMPAPHWLPLKG